MAGVWDIVSKVGTGLIKDLPFGETLLAGVNALLPDDMQLGTEASGKDVQDTISRMSPEQQAQVLSLQYEVDLETIKQPHETARTMLETEMKSSHSTRPKIALEASRFCYLISILIIGTVGWAVVTKDTEMMTAIGEAWVLLLGLPTLFVGWVNRYFGILRDEQANKLNAASGQAATNIGGILSRILPK